MWLQTRAPNPMPCYIKKDVHTSIKGVSRRKLDGTNALRWRLTRWWSLEPPSILWTWRLPWAQHGSVLLHVWSWAPCQSAVVLFDTQTMNTSVLYKVWVRPSWGFLRYWVSKDFISRRGHLTAEWWDRVKGSSCCYTRCDCNVTVRTRCLFSLACQLLAVQGRRKRPRWVTPRKQDFLLLPLKCLFQCGRQARSLVSERKVLWVLALCKYQFSKRFKWFFALYNFCI